jgi:hypothetical protein
MIASKSLQIFNDNPLIVPKIMKSALTLYPFSTNLTANRLSRALTTCRTTLILKLRSIYISFVVLKNNTHNKTKTGVAAGNVCNCIYKEKQN